MTRALCTAVAVLATLLLASPASARWHVQRVGGHSSGYEDVALAGNARGDSAVAFDKGGEIALAIAHRGHRFGRAHRVPGSAAGSAPNVAIDEQGNVLVLWNYFDGFEEEDFESRDGPCCNGTKATVRYAHGRHFRHVQPLTPPGHEVTAEAWAIERGRVGVAWSELGRLRARFAARGRPLGRTVNARGEATGLGVSLAHGARRVTYALYGAHATSIREFHVRAGRAVGRRTLARGLPEGAYVAMATNARGDQAVAWQPGDYVHPIAVHLAVRGRGGRFHSRVVSHDGPVDSAPVVAIGRSGAAVAAWPTPRGKLLVSSRRPGGRFGVARRFDRNARGTFVLGVEVAVDAFGRSVIGWTQHRPDRVARFFGAFRSPSGTRSRARAFGSAYDVGTQRSAAIDAFGRARLVWRAPSGVKVARAPYTGP